MKESVPPAVAAKTSATGSGGAASRGGLLAQVRAAGRASPVRAPSTAAARAGAHAAAAEARAAAAAAPRAPAARSSARADAEGKRDARAAHAKKHAARARRAGHHGPPPRFWEPDAAPGPRGRASGTKREEGLLRRSLEARERRRPGPEAPERM